MSKTISEKLVEIAENEKKVYDAGYTEGLKNGGGGGDGDGSYDEGFEAGKAEGIEIGRAEGLTEGYEQGEAAGKKAEYDAFWDAYQINGTRTNYTYAFGSNCWSDDTFKPKYNISGTMDHIFYNSQITEKGLKDAIDRGIIIDFSKSSLSPYALAVMPNLTEIPFDVSLEGIKSENNMVGVFSYNQNLETIKKIVLKADGTTPIYAGIFSSSPKIKNVTFEGVIGVSFDLSTLKYLSADSIRSIMEHLSGTASGKTLTLSATAVANSKTNGEYYFSAYANGTETFTANTITLYPGQTIKVTWEIEDGHGYMDHANGDWWFGLCEDSGAPTRENGWTYTATGGTEEIPLKFVFAAGNADALGKRIKIKAAKINTDTGEEYETHPATNPTAGGSSAWVETMFDYWHRVRSNWTISTQ